MLMVQLFCFTCCFTPVGLFKGLLIVVRVDTVKEGCEPILDEELIFAF